MNFKIILKWKYSRWVVRQQQISFKKFLCRMHYIQVLEKLPQYDHERLISYGYRKLRKLFIKEYPEAYLHNPYKD